MSVERYWRWRCEHEGCGAEAVVQDYGLPKGWIFVKGRIITHRCAEHAKSVDKHLIGLPKVTASK